MRVQRHRAGIGSQSGWLHTFSPGSFLRGGRVESTRAFYRPYGILKRRLALTAVSIICDTASNVSMYDWLLTVAIRRGWSPGRWSSAHSFSKVLSMTETWILIVLARLENMEDTVRQAFFFFFFKNNLGGADHYSVCFDTNNVGTFSTYQSSENLLELISCSSSCISIHFLPLTIHVFILDFIS